MQGELLHRHSKRRFGRTNGNEYVRQMEKIQRIESRLSDIKQDLIAFKQPVITPTKPRPTMPSSSTLAHEELPLDNAGRLPYRIALSQKNQILLPTWLDAHRSDPAVKVSKPYVT